MMAGAALPREPEGDDSGGSQTLRAQLRLRELIVNGEITPNVRIPELALVERLGVSRTPVRAGLITVAALSWVAVGTPSMFVWVVWGASIDRVLKRPLERRVYAWVMSLAVAATAVWMLR